MEGRVPGPDLKTCTPALLAGKELWAAVLFHSEVTRQEPSASGSLSAQDTWGGGAPASCLDQCGFVSPNAAQAITESNCQYSFSYMKCSSVQRKVKVEHMPHKSWGRPDFPHIN